MMIIVHEFRNGFHISYIQLLQVCKSKFECRVFRAKYPQLIAELAFSTCNQDFHMFIIQRIYQYLDNSFFILYCVPEIFYRFHQSLI